MVLGIVTSQECEEKLSTGSVQDKNSKPRDKTLSKPPDGVFVGHSPISFSRSEFQGFCLVPSSMLCFSVFTYFIPSC